VVKDGLPGAHARETGNGSEGLHPDGVAVLPAAGSLLRLLHCDGRGTQGSRTQGTYNRHLSSNFTHSGGGAVCWIRKLLWIQILADEEFCAVSAIKEE